MVDVLDDIDAWLLDQDGVLFHGNEPIEGSLDAVALLRAAGKRVAYITNNSGKTREDVAARLSSHGVPCTADEVLTSGHCAAQHLLDNSLRTAFVVGEPGLKAELRAAGIECNASPPGELFLDEVAFAALWREPCPQAVVVGLDHTFTMAKLQRASAFVQRGAVLIGTNPDAGDKCGVGLTPGAGALIAAVEVASDRSAIIVGKPQPAMLLQLLARHGLDARRVVMVGDRLDTDVRFGNAAGVKTCLVLTGVATAQDAAAAVGECRPDVVLPSLAHAVKQSLRRSIT